MASLERMSNADLRDMAYALGLALDANETKADLVAKIAARKAELEAAVALVIENDAPNDFGEDGYPKVAAVNGALGEDTPAATEAAVREATEAVWAAREDAVADAGTAGEEQGGAGSQGGGKGGREAAAPSAGQNAGPRAAVVQATEEIVKAGKPLERGAPALWAVRDRVTELLGEGSPGVGKAEAAAAYEQATGKAWPWPPTQQELRRQQGLANRYPAGLYHKDKAAITVKDEAGEAAAHKNGYRRPEDMKPADWVAAWARETGASPEQAESALKGIRDGRIKIA